MQLFKESNYNFHKVTVNTTKSWKSKRSEVKIVTEDYKCWKYILNSSNLHSVRLYRNIKYSKLLEAPATKKNKTPTLKVKQHTLKHVNVHQMQTIRGKSSVSWTQLCQVI